MVQCTYSIQTGCAPVLFMEIHVSDVTSYLCGLALLLKLLQLLCSQKTHWFVPSDQFCPCWHRSQDDISTQPTDAKERELLKG